MNGLWRTIQRRRAIQWKAFPLCIWVSCLCTTHRSTEKCIGYPGLELHWVMSWYVGARNTIQVLLMLLMAVSPLWPPQHCLPPSVIMRGSVRLRIPVERIKREGLSLFPPRPRGSTEWGGHQVVIKYRHLISIYLCCLLKSEPGGNPF